jgi:hypothetical protein
MTQSAAFDALAGQDRAVAVEMLRTHVQDTSQPTRLQALGLLVERSGADLLREALADSDETVRNAAATLLRQAER